MGLFRGGLGSCRQWAVEHRNSIGYQAYDLEASGRPLYALVRRVFRMIGITSEADVEVLVLRHELSVLRRQIKGPKLRRTASQLFRLGNSTPGVIEHGGTAIHVTESIGAPLFVEMRVAKKRGCERTSLRLMSHVRGSPLIWSECSKASTPSPLTALVSRDTISTRARHKMPRNDANLCKSELRV